jgi:hypothetical protein
MAYSKMTAKKLVLLGGVCIFVFTLSGWAQWRGMDSKVQSTTATGAATSQTQDNRPSDRSSEKRSGEPGNQGLGHILSLYGNSGSAERKSSMQQLIDESVTFLKEVHKDGFPPEVRSILESSMVDVTARAYSILESISLELNNALGPSELWLSCTPPQFVSETLKFDRMRNPVESVTTFRARISSNVDSIVIRAHKGKVEFMLIPSDRAVGLTKVEANYHPLMTFTGLLRDNHVEWQVEDRPLTEARLEKFCIEFFKYFLDETRKHIKQPPVKTV